jgi:hypothetical protein
MRIVGRNKKRADMKIDAKELIYAILIGLVTNLLWALIAQQINLALIALIFFVSIAGFFIVWNYTYKPLALHRKSRLKNYYSSSKDARRQIVDKLRSATHIRLITIGGGMIAEDDHAEVMHILEKRAKEGAMLIRILLLNPHSKEMDCRIEELENLRPGVFVSEVVKSGIENNAKKIASLNKKIGVRYYNSQPVWRLFIIDDLAFVSSYLREKEGHKTDMFVFQGGTDLFQAFQRMFDYMWTIGLEPGFDGKLRPTQHQADGAPPRG